MNKVNNIKVFVGIVVYLVALVVLNANKLILGLDVVSSRIILNIVVAVVLSFLLYNIKVNTVDSTRKISASKFALFSVVGAVVVLVAQLVFEQGARLFGYLISKDDFMRLLSFNSNNIFYLISTIVVLPIITQLIFTKVIFGKIYDLHSGVNNIVKFLSSVLVAGVVYGVCTVGFNHNLFLYVAEMAAFGGLYLYSRKISIVIVSNILVNLAYLVYVLI